MIIDKTYEEKDDIFSTHPSLTMRLNNLPLLETKTDSEDVTMEILLNELQQPILQLAEKHTKILNEDKDKIAAYRAFRESIKY